VSEQLTLYGTLTGEERQPQAAQEPPAQGARVVPMRRARRA
jgi:hypothetical protein